MNEEYVSGALYRAAVDDPEVSVISWQSIDGKGYFAADVKLRLPDQRRFEPDLVLDVAGHLWLIEVKATHMAALADEVKLTELLGLLGESEIIRQVSVRSGRNLSGRELVLAVAFQDNDLPGLTEGPKENAPETTCIGGIVHVDWGTLEPAVAAGSLAVTLSQLQSARQSST